MYITLPSAGFDPARRYNQDVQLAERLQRFAALIRRILGVPDYERYVAHVRAAHPGQVPMTEREFFKDRLEARAKPGSRCC
jgi:uncharacterized short protein YbdD (DUF466 family)